MRRLLPSSVLIFTVALPPAVQAQDKEASPWIIDRTLVVVPQAAPVPAFKYRLLPLTSDLKEGNAVPIYLRLVHSQSDASRKYWTETPVAWNKLPVDRIPVEQARKFLEEHPYMLRQLEIGARRRTVDWHYTLDEPNPIGLLLPDIQSTRSYLPMLLLQARLALAEGDFSKATHHLQTGFAFSRHISAGPTLIQSLVGVAEARQFASVVADCIECRGSPNLYWALTALPRPLIDLRRPLEWEYQMLKMQIPDLTDRDRGRTAEQWDAALRRVRTELSKLAPLGPKGAKYFPNDCGPDDPAAKSPDLPEARKVVARVKGLSADKVEAMPPAQVLLLYMAATYQEDRDSWYRGAFLPYPQAQPFFEAARKWLRDVPTTEGHIAARLLLPALDKVMSSQTMLERNLAALRVIEALRIYAAAHDGKLPEKLADVTEVPLPDDPGTGRPFEYSRDGATATLISQVPNDPSPRNGVRYRVTIRKN
jgi:hypothetical protein